MNATGSMYLQHLFSILYQLSLDVLHTVKRS